jgi:predicted dehydrogenase
MEKVNGDATYTHQLRAFARWVRGGEPMPTDAAHGVANMKVIDAIYEEAGLPIRGA